MSIPEDQLAWGGRMRWCQVGGPSYSYQDVVASGGYTLVANKDTSASPAPGADWDTLARSGTGGYSRVDDYTTPGTFTWTKPAGAVLVQVTTIGGGGGGASGRRGAAASARWGGGGGSVGIVVGTTVPASLLGATETVTVGAGGTAALGASADNSDGSQGGTGGLSSFGGWCRSHPCNGGSPGTATSGSGGAALAQNIPGATSSVSAVPVSAQQSTFGLPGGGGAGGGISATDVRYDGGQGSPMYNWGPFTGNNGGVGAGAAGTAGNSSPTGTVFGGRGGGGGASGDIAATLNGGNGANGGFPGGGGGGGGASVNGRASGAGGVGGNGMVRVITYF